MSKQWHEAITDTEVESIKGVPAANTTSELSIAVSLKRIADVLERLEAKFNTPPGGGPNLER